MTAGGGVRGRGRTGGRQALRSTRGAGSNFTERDKGRDWGQGRGSREGSEVAVPHSPPCSPPPCIPRTPARTAEPGPVHVSCVGVVEGVTAESRAGASPQTRSRSPRRLSFPEPLSRHRSLPGSGRHLGGGAHFRSCEGARPLRWGFVGLGGAWVLQGPGPLHRPHTSTIELDPAGQSGPQFPLTWPGTLATSDPTNLLHTSNLQLPQNHLEQALLDKVSL